MLKYHKTLTLYRSNKASCFIENYRQIKLKQKKQAPEHSFNITVKGLVNRLKSVNLVKEQEHVILSLRLITFMHLCFLFKQNINFIKDTDHCLLTLLQLHVDRLETK
jgi:G:T-mismatch repair DNA endonuclease (very short patch repair protein)